jgi:hypothetical protein
MFSIGNKVADKDGIKGVVRDLDEGQELSIGVLFEDDDTTIWWMKESDLTRCA